MNKKGCSMTTGLSEADKELFEEERKRQAEENKRLLEEEDKTPGGLAERASQAEKEGDFLEAADLYWRAAAASLGHGRSGRYMEAEERCRIKHKEKSK